MNHQDLETLADLVAGKIADRLSMLSVSRWITLQEAMSYAKVKKTCLMKLISQGKIHAKKTSPGRGGWRVDRVSIDDMLNEGRIR